MELPATIALNDAEVFAHRYVEDSDAVRFLSLARTRHGEVPFLTDGYLGNPPPLGDVAANQCLALLPDRPIHYIFHSAFCGSTLLARAFDQPGLAMGLSEPMILNDIVGYRRRGAQAAQLMRLADVATRLLARPFGAGEMVVVKPSNVINPLARLLLAARPSSRAIFLYAPIEMFLVSVAHKGLSCRLWVRELFQGLWREGIANLGVAADDLFQLTDLQVAALGWLAQHRLFAELMAGPAGARLASLDSETMLADPAVALHAAAAHLQAPISREQAQTMATGAAFGRHSKSGETYSAHARADAYAKVRDAHRDEITKVVVWIGEVARVNGIALSAPKPLVASRQIMM
jgi:hypothetical protein